MYLIYIIAFSLLAIFIFTFIETYLCCKQEIEFSQHMKTHITGMRLSNTGNGVYKLTDNTYQIITMFGLSSNEIFATFVLQDGKRIKLYNIKNNALMKRFFYCLFRYNIESTMKRVDSLIISNAQLKKSK